MATKKRTGKAADSIFASPAPTALPPEPSTPTPAPAVESRGPGRPATKPEPWRKTTAILYDSQAVWLDRLAVDLYEQTGVRVTRAEILRALVAGLQQSGLNLVAEFRRGGQEFRRTEAGAPGEDIERAMVRILAERLHQG